MTVSVIRKWKSFILLFPFLLMLLAPVSVEAAGEVYVVPVEETVEKGMASFIDRAITEAEDAGAKQLIFEIDTPGGRVDAANEIGEYLTDTDVPTAAYVTSRAYSAGSYIALNMDEIYMKSQSTMGASGVINSDGTAADKKAQSAWISAMTAAAENTGRDPLYAKAMADKSIDLPEYGAPKGEFLTLTPAQAVEVGYSSETLSSMDAVVKKLGFEPSDTVRVEPTFSENLARFLTNPAVVPILLSLASLGLIAEIYTPGFGIPGSIGIMSLVLFFYGHVIAGLAGLEAIILLVAGIALIIAEIFLPGGIAGIGGAVAIVASLLMSGQDLGHMAFSIGIAIVVTIVASVLLFKFVGFQNNFFKKIVLSDSTNTSEGYVSSRSRLELIGETGESLTPLRPSGSGVFGDERLDVVSEGSFIQAGTGIKIVKVEGSRIVVREIGDNKEEKS
ncbi:NfeD family protein [Salimicrobium salexigens]|uniref:NfeD family protein n=1 Tax=Salimicrobium salexigens TaxID=908941 RepID=UPI0009714319|nr:nodulation protein NfeD [Salimicrobium salexigens]